MKTLLVVDGDNRVRNIVRLLFTENMGYRVVAAISGEDAVLKAKKLKPEVILSDIYLDDWDGYRISKEIKRDPLLRNTIVVLLCPEFATCDTEKIIESNADDVISKPIEKEIVNKVESLIEQKRKINIEFPVIHPREIFSSITELQEFYKKHIELWKYTYHKLYEFILQTKGEGLRDFYQRVQESTGKVRVALRKQRNMKTPFQSLRSNLTSISLLPLSRTKLSTALLIIMILPIAYILVSSSNEIQKHFYHFLSALRPTEGFTLSKTKRDEPKIGKADIPKVNSDLSSSVETENGGFGPGINYANLVKFGNVSEDIATYDLRDLLSYKSITTEQLSPQDKEPQDKENITKKKEASIENKKQKMQLKGNKYEVNKGDSLFRIARKFNTSVKELKATNNLKSDNIRIGQMLIIPTILEKPRQKIVVMKKKNDLYGIKVDRSSFYMPLSGVPVHSLIFENPNDIAYRDVKVKISYYSNLGNEMGSETVTLPIVVPPHSKKNYIKEGVSINPNQSDIYSANVEVLSATPLMRIVDQVKLDR